MLVFFIHGVAESKVKFAEPLKSLIKNEFLTRGKSLPYFHTGFYADVLNSKGKIWNFIQQELESIRQEYPKSNTQDIFRGQEFREQFLSDFIGDAFAYLNLERGAKIRASITEHLEDFINNHPEEKEIHIVAHSMGTVILWDMLFSNKFQHGDAVFKFRSLIKDKVDLVSITTMGSPVILFNMIFDIKAETINEFLVQYQKENLKWINIIHSSDMIAYPISTSLTSGKSYLHVENKFITTEANHIEKSIKNLGKSSPVEAASQLNAGISHAFSFATLAAGAGDAHINYWKCPQTAKMIVDNILDTKEKIINLVIAHLESVPGMTTHFHGVTDFIEKTIPNTKNKWGEWLGDVDKLTYDLRFVDGSGRLRLRQNIAQIPHVSVYDSDDKCQFRGYVGLIHANGLQKEVEIIQQKYCLLNITAL
ncbi:hypothetical protein NIES2109_01750 [Nostoc sp. HK-01]|uniref:Uncharacterized protein n=1 Tax=Anabaenopsis circularis NIES-21 TaxID=1085406 RepID=A0A1Z4GLZ6_9CYAN|nr:hypothetical protein NIES21_43460 [Anabaenopsis circularis NIES-21]BBD57409.1 hypothetical protein NIES2109_01750 [Nostoc sp. HK-01]